MNSGSLVLHAVLLVLPLASGCPDVGPCGEVESGDRIEMTLSGGWLGSAPGTIEDDGIPSCGLVDLPPSTAILSIHGYAAEQGTCKIPACPADFPSASEPVPTDPMPYANYVCARSDRKIVTEKCDAGRFVSVEVVSGKDPFSPASKVILTRTLSSFCDEPLTLFPEDALREGGYFECSDTWAVTLKRK